MRRNYYHFLVFIGVLLCGQLFPVSGSGAPPVNGPLPPHLLPKPNITTQQLLAQAKKTNPQRFEYVEKNGGRIVPTRDGRSFLIFWHPERAVSHADIPMIVTFSGHGSYAQDEFYLWHKMAEEYGFGIIAVQWWLGQGEKQNDYYLMREVYPDLENLFRREGYKPGRILLHGFSRGSANIYSLVGLDQQTGNRYFGLTIANAGKMQADFFENRPFIGPNASVFKGTRWILFCGKQDPHPERDGCAGMTETETWLKNQGAAIELFIQDENGDHGGFHRNPANMRKALDTYQRILKSS